MVMIMISSPLMTKLQTQQSDIPTKILKQNSDYFADYFYEIVNQCVSKSVFLNIPIRFENS